MLSGDFMTIEQLDSHKMLIVLCRKDMQNFALEYNTLSFDNPHSKKILRRLLTLACNRTEAVTTDKKMIVEALPYDDGCLILVTIKDKIKRKIYKVKKKKYTLCFSFENTENLFSFASSFKADLCVPDNSLYYYNKNFFVILENIENYKNFVPKGKEFCREYKKDRLFCAKIMECGKKILEKEAIEKLNEYF